MGNYNRTLVTKINWHEVYNNISEVLENYEGNGDPELKDNPYPLYDLLCEIKENLSECVYE